MAEQTVSFGVAHGDFTRPQRHVKRVEREFAASYPQSLPLWSLIEDWRRKVQRAYPVPAHCFIPHEITQRVFVRVDMAHADDLSEPFPEDESIYQPTVWSGLAAWRMTQGIYRFDPTLFDEIVATEAQDRVPVEVFKRLPEWCVYIETPNLRLASDNRLYGFFAYLDWSLSPSGPDSTDEDWEEEERAAKAAILKHWREEWEPLFYGPYEESTLFVILDTERQDLCPLMFAFDTSPIADVSSENLRLRMGGPPWGEMESEALAVSTQASHLAGHPNMKRLAGVPRAVLEQQARSVAGAIVSSLLYLCSVNADIRAVAGDATRPTVPQPVRTKKGERLFAPSAPRTWLVGSRIGPKLRAAYRSGACTRSEAHSSLRPHVRRAHWHSFWKGPKSDPARRETFLKWLPPIAVNVETADDLVATIRQVD